MKVKAGSKLNKIVGYAMAQFKEDSLKQIVFSGTGNAITKTVTCVEIMKRKFRSVHQITKLGTRKIEELWEPKLEGLDRLKVVREQPTIHVLLSKNQLDQNELGYQQGKICTILTKNSTRPTSGSSNGEKITPRRPVKKRKQET